MVDASINFRIRLTAQLIVPAAIESRHAGGIAAHSQKFQLSDE